MEWNIGNVKIKNQVVLSPMAGVCNEVFRIICHEFNAGLVVCEMVSDKALMFKNEKTLAMTKVREKEHPVSLQIFGSDIESMVGAAKFIDKYSNCDIIDINMGCPVPKVVKTGAGSALLQTPQRRISEHRGGRTERRQKRGGRVCDHPRLDAAAYGRYELCA